MNESSIDRWAREYREKLGIDPPEPDADSLDVFADEEDGISPAEMLWRERQDEGVFATMDWGALATSQPPERPWIVPGLLPTRSLALLAGGAGTGKTLLKQQWLASVATGASFLGMEPSQPVPVLMVNCEDDHDELWRRQWDICRALGVSFLDLQEAGFHVLPRLGMDNSLGTFDAAGRFKPSELFVYIRAFALARGVRVIALDNIAHIFSGNENDRAMVTAFCSKLASLALEIDGAVILIGHPAKGLGSQWSGSTAWEACVRTRLYLSRETDAEGKEVEGSDMRTLSLGKANYAGKGWKVDMQWRAGAFYPVAVGDTPAAAHVAEDAFLRCLDAATEQRRNVSHVPGTNYAPARFARMAEAGKQGERALAAAMERLLSRGVIEVDRPLWRDVHRKWKTGLSRAATRSDPLSQPVENIAATPAATPCGDLRQPPSQPVENIAATVRAAPPLYTTCIEAGPVVPPPPTDTNEGEGAGHD
jgi:RecA-family ATPase